MHLTRAHVKIDVVQGVNTRERLGHAPDLEQQRRAIGMHRKTIARYTTPPVVRLVRAHACSFPSEVDRAGQVGQLLRRVQQASPAAQS